MAARFSTLRPGVALGRSVLQTCRRLQSTETSAASTAPAVPPPPRRGGIRGGASIVGFLFGFSLASAFASYHLLEEYRLASAVLQSSVHELQTSTQKVSAHVRRIETVEKELKALAERTAEKGEVSKLRTEVKQLYDGLHIEFLDLRAHVWGLQQDLHKMSRESEPVKIAAASAPPS